ncbi:helix-turn-helix transcriptional regulator [Prauserella flavalba]|uniref:helix-turn-helix transcriptional regulator n=1 Tax=Prauserella flavalba TaxID=1477506 RepID=UPI0036E3543F
MPTTSARLLALLSLLQARRDWPAALLAERLGVSARTVRRDVDRLRGLGEASVRALTTVRQVMPARLRRRIDTLRVTVAERTTDPPVDSGALMALGTAVHAREVLRFGYAPADAPRRVEPHHLVARGGRWYLLAWDLDRDDWRTFRADRITPRIPAGPRFSPREVPGGDVAAFIAARFSGSDGTSPGWPCVGEVILGLPAADVSPFARDGVVEELDPGRCRLVLGSWSWTGLAAAIGRFDADLEVVGPPELAAAFARLARRYAAAVEGTPAR